MSKAARVRKVKERIQAEPSFALRVFRRIYNAQKPEEKFSGRHMGHDGRGWREREAYTLNTFYERLEEQDWLMSPSQMEFLQERTQPYAAQYLRLVDEATENRRDELKSGRR